MRPECQSPAVLGTIPKPAGPSGTTAAVYCNVGRLARTAGSLQEPRLDECYGIVTVCISRLQTGARPGWRGRCRVGAARLISASDGGEHGADTALRVEHLARRQLRARQRVGVIVDAFDQIAQRPQRGDRAAVGAQRVAGGVDVDAAGMEHTVVIR